MRLSHSVADPAVDIRARTRSLLDALQMPPKFTVAVLVAQLNRSRGRRVELKAFPLPVTGPCGLLIAGAEVDMIVYQEATTPVHQMHIVLHEIGHLVFSHERSAGDGADFDTEAEFEAELFATLLQERAAIANIEWPDSPASSDYRFYHLLNMKRGWP